MKTQWRCQDGKSSSLMTSASGKCLEPSKVKCGNLFDGRCERCVGSGLVWLVVLELDTFGHQQLQLYHSDWQWSLTTDTDHQQQLQVSDLCQEVGGQTSRFSSVGGWLDGHFDLIHFTIGGGTDRRVKITKLFFQCLLVCLSWHCYCIHL